MQSNSGMKPRNAEREGCRITGTLRHMSQIARARVVDLSDLGMGLELTDLFRFAQGALVTIDTPELGLLEGHVAWQDGRHIGIRLKLNSNSHAQVSSYFRFFHEKRSKAIRR
jgi:hypothetical protein